MGFTYLRKYENPINHEPYVGFQFFKLFWNPYNILKQSILKTFSDLSYIRKCDLLDLHYRNIFVNQWCVKFSFALNYKVVFQYQESDLGGHVVSFNFYDFWPLATLYT